MTGLYPRSARREIRRDHIGIRARFRFIPSALPIVCGSEDVAKDDVARRVMSRAREQLGPGNRQCPEARDGDIPAAIQSRNLWKQAETARNHERSRAQDQRGTDEQRTQPRGPRRVQERLRELEELQECRTHADAPGQIQQQVEQVVEVSGHEQEAEQEGAGEPSPEARHEERSPH